MFGFLNSLQHQNNEGSSISQVAFKVGVLVCASLAYHAPYGHALYGHAQYGHAFPVTCYLDVDSCNPVHKHLARAMVCSMASPLPQVSSLVKYAMLDDT